MKTTPSFQRSTGFRCGLSKQRRQQEHIMRKIRQKFKLVVTVNMKGKISKITKYLKKLPKDTIHADEVAGSS